MSSENADISVMIVCKQETGSCNLYFTKKVNSDNINYSADKLNYANLMC